MAYSLESLIGILEKILEPDHQYLILHHKRPQIECLLEKASVLKHLLEKSSPMSSKRMESLEGRIRDASHEAEDIIESHVANQVLLQSGSVADESFLVNPQDLLRIFQEFDSVKEDIMKIVDENQSSSSSLMPDVSSNRDPNAKNIVVGLDKDLLELKEQLDGQSLKLEIIPIVGMGGIGKTTLARTIYNDSFIVSHFDNCAWITISQDYNLREMLLGLLSCIIGKLDDKMLQMKNERLAVDLHKSLRDRRYLIILDDIWSTKVWDGIKMCFPDDYNASRVMLTTRESNVASYAASKSLHHQMHLLNEVDSWNLLCEKVFAQENCPPQLEKIGRNIAYNCRGLPLAIHVVGGLLSKGKKAQEFWENVAKDISSAVVDKDEQFSKILSLSYNHLPHHLKPCFLYMGAFPEDYEIRASKLIRLWVAEGFLKPIGDKSMEEAAKVYLKAIVDRNLILVRQQEFNGKVKYSVHDLLRDLCVRKARQENFLHVKNRQVLNVSEDTICLRRVSVHSSYRIRDIYDSMESMSLARSFLCIGRVSHVIMSPIFLTLRLLRVLDVFEIEFHEFPVQILQIVNLRLLAFTCYSELPSSISRLWNLQTLIRRGQNYSLPSEIWEMPELRHLKIKQGSVYCDFQFMTNFIMEKLQTLSGFRVDKFNLENLIGSFRNVKKLGISCSFNIGQCDLTPLNKLEILKCSSIFQQYCYTTFPSSLKKLTLSKWDFPWKFMSTVGMLPNLEVLKLRTCAFLGPEEETLEAEWEPTEGEFSALKFLSLQQVNLVHWLADQTHFPILEHLIIRYCSGLKEIPCGIGEILTLEMIELYKCNPSVVDSAKQIQKDQQEYGNYGLQLRLYGTSSQ